MSLPQEWLGYRTQELFALPVSEEKSRFVEGNYLLAAREVFKWYDLRRDYINFRGAPNRDKAYLDEIAEYQAERDEHFIYIVQNRSRDRKWYEDPIRDRITKIAGEAADVAIVGASELQRMGYGPEWVASLWNGDFDLVEFRDGWIRDFRDFMAQARADFREMQIDLAEAITLKSALNEQHYPSVFYPWLHVVKYGPEDDLASFSRRMRRGVGDRNSHQMPALDISLVGELTLSRAQKSPFSSDGFAPQAIKVENGEIQVNSGDFDNVYAGMYAVGMVHGLYDLAGHRFEHNPENADYVWHYASTRWRETMNKVKERDIAELIVPSGSGFRFKGLEALCRFEDLKFEHMGTVEDEIQFKQYLRWCEIEVRKPDIFEYQMFVAEGKIVRLGLDHDKLDQTQTHEGLVVGMDEIIVWWNDKSQQYEPIEKPANEIEAADQILRLVSGVQFFVSNATVVSHLKITKPGEGFAAQIIPMRVECSDDDERLQLASIWLDRYRRAVRKEGSAKVTPGAVSLMSDFLQPHIRVRLPAKLEDMVIPFGESYRYREFMQNLIDTNEEVKFLSLPEKVQNEIGISVGGFSIVGARQAFERYLLTSSWQSQASLDHSRADRLAQLKKMMQIDV